MTRGERNCNPLNIRRVAGTVWRGQRDEQTDKEFVQFLSVGWGLRAAFCLLRTYRNKYQCLCIEDIISRWAPPSENNTREYINAVCRLTGFGGQERLTAAQMPSLVKAMARIESCIELTDAQLQAGWQLYQTT